MELYERRLQNKWLFRTDGSNYTLIYGVKYECSVCAPSNGYKVDCQLIEVFTNS